jgi:hypothetical protein
VARRAGLDPRRLRARHDGFALARLHAAVCPRHLDDRDHRERRQRLRADAEPRELAQQRLVGEARRLAQRRHRGLLERAQAQLLAVVRRCRGVEGPLERPTARVEGVRHRHLRSRNAR